jgi:nucleotide-binding universal stress UspA family protein
MNEILSSPGAPGEVVVGVDGSPGSFAVVLHGIGVARDTGAALRLVHVTPLVDPLLPFSTGSDQVLVRHGRAILTGMVARARAAAPGQDIRHTLGVGSRHAELARAARRASMVVLGRRERQGVRGLPSGSTAIALSGALDCPVRVVPRDWLSRIHLDDVVVGVDDVRTAAPLLRRGLELAAGTSGTLVVAHAWDLPPGYEGVLTPEDVSRRNAHAAAELEHAFIDLRLEWPTVPVRTEVLPGRPHEVLATLSAEAALVLVGRPDRPHLLGRLGPTPRALLMSSEAPVEVGPRTGRPHEVDPEIATELDTALDTELEEGGAMLR